MTAAIPETVRGGVAAFVDTAREVLRDDLVSVVLFGSAATGALRPTSDVNLLLILRRFDRARIDVLREPFRTAQAALNLQTMFILQHELPAASEAFAQKFDDIAHRRVVLFGPDLVSDIRISREALIRRVRQVLLNQALRLREAYVSRSLREEQAAAVIADAAGPLRASAASILELEGRPAFDPKAALQTLAAESGDARFRDVLPMISTAREQRILLPGAGAPTLFDLIELVVWLRERAMTLN